MKTLRSKIFFLTVFLTSCIQSELRPDAENVCPQLETYEETVIEKVRRPVKEYKYKRCKNIFKKFSCKKLVTNWKVVDEPRVVQKSRAVLKCCNGFKEIQEDVTRCVPICSTGCVHGKCTAPDKCTCTPGFYGPVCSMRSVMTTVRRNPVAESSTQEIFQTTEKSELENPTLMPEILKVTNTDFITETTGRVTVSTDATVTMTDAASYERYTTELDEKEILREKFQNAKFTIALDVESNLSALITASTEETGRSAKYSDLNEAVGLGNSVSNSSETLSTEGNEISSETKPNLESEENALDPTKVYGKNLQVYDFTSLLYVFPISCFVLAIALWIIVKRRKKIRKSHIGKQHPFYSKEPFVFCMENLLWSKLFRNHSESPIGRPDSTHPILLELSQCNRSESPINMWEARPNKAKPVLKDLQDCDRHHAIHSEGTFI